MKEILQKSSTLFGLIPKWVRVDKIREDNDPEVQNWERLVKQLPTFYKIRKLARGEHLRYLILQPKKEEKT